jgi:hypothetical protein
MERNADYLLSIEPDRLLHNTRLYAGFAPKGEIYGGWESAGIAGHTLGHYLTAISQQYAATGDARFKKRIDYIISEMAACQQAYGDGYIGALPAHRARHPARVQGRQDRDAGPVQLQERGVGALVHRAQGPERPEGRLDPRRERPGPRGHAPARRLGGLGHRRV